MKLAVVGAGIGGGSLCRFLRQLEEDVRKNDPSCCLQIDVYEDSIITGGRLRVEPVASTSSTDKTQYEVGGAVIHKTNLYMKTFCEELGITRVLSTSNTTLLLAGGENNSSIILRTSKWPGSTAATLLYRYGLDLFRLYFALRHQLKLFCSVYIKQQNVSAACDDVLQMLELFTPSDSRKNEAYSFRQQCSRTLRDQLMVYGNFRRPFVEEIAQAAARVNYGQTVDDLHGLTGLISLAGAQDNSLWHVLGGNHIVPAALLKLHATNLFVNHRVKKIRYSPTTTKAQLTIVDKASGVLRDTAEYDCVIVACPLATDGIMFENVDSGNALLPNVMPLKYQRIVTTLIDGDMVPLASKFHGLPIAETDETIFLTPPSGPSYTTKTDVLPFNSVAFVKPVDQSNKWWSFFWRRPATEVRVRKVFSSVPFDVDEYFSPRLESKNINVVSTTVHAKTVPALASTVVDWLAYPQYASIRAWFCANSNNDTVNDNAVKVAITPPVTMMFKLVPQRGLYYINAIETIGSAMEMSAIGAKNVALLIQRDFFLDQQSIL